MLYLQDVQMFPSAPVAIFLQPQTQERFNYKLFLKIDIVIVLRA